MFSDIEDDIDGDADLATVAPPIQALDGKGNPFHTITAETVIFDEDHGDRSLSTKVR